MKLQYLGTAAAEGVPAFFCGCEHCRYAQRVGGVEMRTRSGAMVDDGLKIDFGPDTLAHMYRYCLDFSHLEHVLITHSHEDHFTPADIAYRRKGFCHPPEDAAPLRIYGNEAVCRRVDEMNVPGVESCLMTPFAPTPVGPWTVSALKAVHMIGSDEQPLFYLVEREGKSLLYAHDTDEFPEEDLEFLAGRRIDCVSLDCTNGVKHFDYRGHMGVENNLRMRDKMLENGAADRHTRFICSHFSHNGLAPYARVKEAARGMDVAYDGMVVEF